MKEKTKKREPMGVFTLGRGAFTLEKGAFVLGKGAYGLGKSLSFSFPLPWKRLLFLGELFLNVLLFGTALPCRAESARVNGVSLAYTIEGEGYPVVLMHGNGGSRENLRTQREELIQAGFQVYSFDSRGQGENGPIEPEMYHYEEMAEDAYELIQLWGLVRPFFYGWSDGGIVGLLLELNHPGTLGAFAGSGVNIDPKGLKWFVRLGFWVGSLFDASGLTRMVVNEPNISTQELEGLSLPVLLTAGEKDIVKEAHTCRIAEAISGARLEIFPGEDHGSYILHSHKLGEVLIPFFQNLV